MVEVTLAAIADGKRAVISVGNEARKAALLKRWPDLPEDAVVIPVSHLVDEVVAALLSFEDWF